MLNIMTAFTAKRYIMMCCGCRCLLAFSVRLRFSWFFSGSNHMNPGMFFITTATIFGLMSVCWDACPFWHWGFICDGPVLLVTLTGITKGYWSPLEHSWWFGWHFPPESSSSHPAMWPFILLVCLHVLRFCISEVCRCYWCIFWALVYSGSQSSILKVRKCTSSEIISVWWF